MNKEEGNSVGIEECIPVCHKGRTVWRWLFVQPALGSAPARLNMQLMVKLSWYRASAFVANFPSSTITPATHIVVDRANRYYAAGCPLDMCEYAAARDLWAAINQVDEPLSASVSKQDSQGPSRVGTASRLPSRPLNLDSDF